MFKKILVANRGEIAARIIRACRDMNIYAVALYDATDRGSLHVRLADECIELTSDLGYMDGPAVLQCALDAGADAIHPGYGFLAEDSSFIRACEDEGITFIGPPSHIVETTRNKIEVMRRVRAAGFDTPVHSATSFGPEDLDLLKAEADSLGYPLVIKSYSGGRGRGAQFVYNSQALEQAVSYAHAEAQMLFGSERLYLERIILPANFIEVQIVGDNYGTLLHLGEREGSVQRNNQKLIAESPAPCLNPAQREQVRQMALDIARMFDLSNVGAVEFLVDDEGRFFFTELKARIQVEHPVTEMVSDLDLVREQIELASGKRITTRQEDVTLRGWAMQCRLNAEDPWNNYLPSPGHLRRFRLPGGPNIRVETYAYSGCDVPVRYDPLLAKLIVWAENRDECVRRMRRVLQDFSISGIRTNLPLFQRILDSPEFETGNYNTLFPLNRMIDRPETVDEDALRDLAVAAAVAYMARYQSFQPTVPDRMRTGWHRTSRQLPDW
ncbi:MAG: biotin carboxylase N-terminal domain-containing protein [Chloroflexota bacterium]|nr:biotin carboxylase N-terminal domain-containing protein [Chloroflexota bacterium]